jgi:hypothetical protein
VYYVYTIVLLGGHRENIITVRYTPSAKKEQGIKLLQDFYREHGRSPSLRDITNGWSFKRWFGTWNNALKSAGLEINCEAGRHIEPHPCLYCGDITKNPKFCDSSHAASYNNSKSPKRNKTARYCKNCGADIELGRKLCDDCWSTYQQSRSQPKERAKIDYKSKLCSCGNFMCQTSKQCIECASKRVYQSPNNMLSEMNKKHRGRMIRYHCRLAHALDLSSPCEKCGYDKHVELHHIRPVSDFPLDATIAEVNNRSNILLVCPNCHWEVHNLNKNGGLGQI